MWNIVHFFNLHHFGYIACSSACMPGSCRVTRSRIQGRLSGYSGYSGYSGTVDTGEAEWGNCHFHMRGRRGENQTIEVFKYFKLSHEGREGEGGLRKPNYWCVVAFQVIGFYLTSLYIAAFQTGDIIYGWPMSSTYCLHFMKVKMKGAAKFAVRIVNIPIFQLCLRVCICICICVYLNLYLKEEEEEG